MSDEDVSMSGRAAVADAPSNNVHDNGESMMGRNSPMHWKKEKKKIIHGKSLNNINGEPVASAPPKSNREGSLKKFGADCQKSPRNAKDKGTK